MNAFSIILALFIGYIIGSIPNGLIISKVVFQKDIRLFGSHNIEGLNIARVFGTLSGIIVTILDILKVILAMFLFNYFALPKEAIAIGGLSTCIGHSYPVFAEFKGGKAFDVALAYLFGMGLFATNDIVFIFVYPVLIFLFILGLFRYTSISSIVSIVSATIIAFITFKTKLYAYLILILALLIIYKHRSNVYRIIKHKEPKIKFLK